MRKRGRPPLDDDVKRGKAYHIRLTKDEHNELKNQAAEEGISVACYIRNRILGWEKVDQNELPEIFREG